MWVSVTTNEVPQQTIDQVVQIAIQRTHEIQPDIFFPPPATP